MWELDCEESWALKNWCFWIVVLEKTLESPLDWKEIQSVHSKGDQPWVFFGRTDAKAETPVLWPPHVKNWLIGKDSDAGRDWGQEEKGMTEDEMAKWHHWLDGCESEWTPELVMDREAWRAAIHGVARVGHDWATELNWTEVEAASYPENLGEIINKGGYTKQQISTVDATALYQKKIPPSTFIVREFNDWLESF